MRCLVIGGSGQLGSILIKQLSQDHEVKSFDTRKPSVCVDGCEYFEGDIRDYAALQKVIEGVDAVFHTVSVIDLAPFPSGGMEGVNVKGTKNIIEVCQEKNVQYLIYTSSIDVVFTGEDIQNGDETLPYASQPLNGYISTKIEAEKLILSANSKKMRTCSLRPSHIYSENDPMITDVLDLVEAGKVPFRFGKGKLSYIHVDNVAHAHVCCLNSLSNPEKADNVAGRPFFISEHVTTFWDFMTPFLKHQGLEPPKRHIPFIFIYILACLVELGCWLLSLVGIVGVGGGVNGVKKGGKKLEGTPPLTKYVVLAVERDYFFSGEEARERMGYELLFEREEGVKRTVEGLEQKGRGKKGEKGKEGGVGGDVLFSHFVYGIVLVYFGFLLFFYPSFYSSIVFPTSSSFPSLFSIFFPFMDDNISLANSKTLQKNEILCQTSGLIFLVLGSYSLFASLSPFSPTYFLLTTPPRIISCLFYLYNLPLLPFLPLIFLELILSFHTLLSLSLSSSSLSISPRFDLLSLSQFLHAFLSGAFAFLMSFSPLLVLPIVFPGGEGEEWGKGVVGWAHVMGDAEFFMTWVYFLSAFLFEMEEFAWLSVYTRLGACFLLFFGFIFSISTFDQLCGVIPDVFLASLTLFLLLREKKKKE